MSKKKKRAHPANIKSFQSSPVVKTSDADTSRYSATAGHSDSTVPNQQSSGAATNAPNRVTEAEPKTNANITATVVSRQTESQGKRWLRWAGSLKWAVTLLSLYAMVVAWATLVDNEYGATAVAWGIYRSGWFAILNLLLGLNVLCSALVRFPWKRRHIGFLMTHAGILMLLVGSAITWSGGIEGVIGVFEGKTSNHLVTEEKQFAITVESIGDENVPSASMASTGEISPKIAPTKVKNTDQQKPTIRRKVSFTPGPFSWAMLGRGELFGQSEAGHGENGPNEAIPAWAKSATKTPMAMFPWRVSTAAGPSTLYEDDQLCVEVVDWLANVELAPLSPLTITFDLRTADERARSVSLDETLTAEVRLSGNPRAVMRGEGGVPARVPVPNRTAVTSKAAKDAAANATNRNQTMDNGGEGFVTYRVAESSAEATAFSKPLSQSDRESTTFGPQGILQLSVAGESLLFSVDTLTVGQRLPLAQTGLTAIFEGRNTGMDHLRLRIVPNAVETRVESANASTPSSPATESAVNTDPTSEVAVGTAATGHDSHATESEGVTMRLFARYPDFNLNDMTDGVVGYWWVPEVPMGVEDTSHASPGTQNAAEIVRAAQSATEADVSDTANAAKPATATSKPIVPVSAEPFLEFLQYGDLLYARYVRDGWASQVICSSDTSNTSGRSTTLAHQQSEAVSAVMEGVCGEGCWRVDLAKSPLGYAVAPGKMLHAVPFPTTRQTDGTTAGTVEDAPKKATRAEREAWIDGGIRAAKVRVRTNGKSKSVEERWLLLDESEVVRFRRMSAGIASEIALAQAGYAATVPEAARRWRLEYAPTDGPRKRVTVSLESRDIPLGFGVRLHEFDRRFNPGSTQASYYASRVDIVAPTVEPTSIPTGIPSSASKPNSNGTADDGIVNTVLTSNLLITMNEPAEVVETAGGPDPSTQAENLPHGRAFRLFQTSWRGPWMPGNALFDTLTPVDSEASQLYMTVLSASYDPGSGWKYAGSLFLLVGMTVVFVGRSLRRKKADHVPVTPKFQPNPQSAQPDSVTDPTPNHQVSQMIRRNILLAVTFGTTFLCGNVLGYADEMLNPTVPSTVDTETNAIADTTANEPGDRPNDETPRRGSDHSQPGVPESTRVKTQSTVQGSEDRELGDRPNDEIPRRGSDHSQPGVPGWGEWERLPVLDKGRIRPLDTVARAMVDEVTDRERPIIAPPDHHSPNAERARKLLFPGGKSKRFQPGEVLFGWLAAPEIWREIPIFRASYEELRTELKLPLRDAHGSRYRLTTIAELDANGAYGDWVNSLANPHTAGRVAGSGDPEVRKQLETLYGHVGLVTQLGVDPSRTIPVKSLLPDETYHVYRQYDTFQTRTNRVMQIWGELAQNPLTTQLLTAPVDTQGQIVTDPTVLAAAAKEMSQKSTTVESEGTHTAGEAADTAAFPPIQRAGDAVQHAVMRLLALSLTPEEAAQYQLESQAPDATMALAEIDQSLAVIQTVAQQASVRLTDARAEYFAANRHKTAEGDDSPEAANAGSTLSDAQLVELRTLAFDFQMLARCAEESRFALTESPRGLRMIPSLCVEMLTERRPVEYENPVWLDLRTVLCGSDSLMINYPQTELAELRAAWRDAVRCYGTESPSRETDFAAALHRFVESVRNFGEAVNAERDQKIAQWNLIHDDLSNERGNTNTVAVADGTTTNDHTASKESSGTTVDGTWANPRALGRADSELVSATRYPERSAMGAEFLYNWSRPFMWTWAAALAAMLLFGTERLVPFGWYRRLVTLGGCGMLAVSMLFCVYGFAMRMIISHRSPVATLFETLVFTGLVAAIIGFGFTFWGIVDRGFRQAFIWSDLPWRTTVRHRLTEECLSLHWAWCWCVLRLVLGVVIFYLLAILPYSDAGRPILSLLPTGSSIGKMVAWNIGIVLLILSVWFVPRLFAAIVAACWTILRSLRVHTWRTMVETVYQRRIAVVIGAAFAFVTTFLAYWFPETFNPGMDRLMPVLGDQFWLATHVLTITASYGAGAIGWGLGNIALLYYIFGQYRSTRPKSDLSGDVSEVKEPEICETLAGYNYFSILIAVCLLTLGTILGALWADVSWGRFWAWDQKEVWSLITIFVYMVILHGRYTRWLGNFGMAAGAAVGAASILMAWFGVSFLLPGGLHSYGSLDAQSMKLPFITAIIVLSLNLLLVAVAGLRLQRMRKH